MFLVEQAWWYYEVGRASQAAGRAREESQPGSGGEPPFRGPLRLRQCSPTRCRRRRALQDFVREKPATAHLRSYTLKEFVGLLFERCPGLEPFKPRWAPAPLPCLESRMGPCDGS